MWNETETEYHFHIVNNEGGTALAYSPESGMKLIEQDGFAFKDMAGTGELVPYADWRLSAEERAADLAARLRVEQIAGLMCYSAHQVISSAELTEDQKRFLDGHVRSVLNASARSGVPNDLQAAWANNLQRYAEAGPLAIPCYIASDPRSGSGTTDWPGNLSLAASFDPSLAKEAGKSQSRELRDLGIACFLAPQVDIAGDPRWFRNSGTFGEDPHLVADMVRAFVDGLQSTYDENGEDLGWGKDSVTAMVKHWTGEGASEGGREAHMEGGKYAVYPNHNFEALMIPFVDGAFQLEGKTQTAAAVMSSYSCAFTEDGSLGEIVGSSFSEYKIRELLRERYGFAGTVCTDWMVLNEGKAEGKRSNGWGQKIEDLDMTPGERAFLAVMAGVDQMGGCSNPQVLLDAYAYGTEKIGKEKMDAIFRTSAERLLKGYFLTGMFDFPYIMEQENLQDIARESEMAEALKAHIRTVVMLKNRNMAIRPHDHRLKVYVPVLFEKAHEEYDHNKHYVMTEDKASLLLPVEVLEKYCDVITDDVEGTKITRRRAEELQGIDLVLIPAKDPGNSFPQNGRDKDGNWVPITRQYRPYIADGEHVRRVSLSGNTLPDGTRENRSYYGHQALTTNEEQLDQILEAAAMAKTLGVPSVVAMFTGKAMCFHEFEAEVDGILVTFSGAATYDGGGNLAGEALVRIAVGKDEPSALLPMQMPKDMDAVEAQSEDTPRDMVCYTDGEGHTYDFAYGLNYQGVIQDRRTAEYNVPVQKVPHNRGR